MNILSLFNGLSGLHLACDKAGIQVENCYYSEIDKYANQVTEKNYPNDIQLGDVTKWQEWDLDWSSIDLLAGGSPCQGFSFAGKQAGTLASVNGEIEIVSTREKYLELKARKENLENIIFLSESYLFWEYVLILDHIKSHNPNLKFLLENVKMKKELLQMIDDAMGVKSVVINSALLSAQNRVRHYWCNWEVKQPDDKGILLRDILEETAPPEFNLSDEAIAYMGRLRNGKPRWEYHRNPTEGKAACLTANMYKGVPYGVLQLRPCERIKEGNEGHIANATDIKGMDCIKRVYGQDGKAPTLTTMGGGHREPKVLINESATKQDKSYTLTASYGGAVAWNSCERKQRTMVPICESDSVEPNVYNGVLYRKLTPVECERLQTVPDNWTDCVSKTQRYKMIGNGWTIDVIAHILSFIK